MKTQQLKKLFAFILITIWVFFFSIANAQIAYTDVNPDQTFNTNGNIYPLDLNNDGLTDFNISYTTSSVTGTCDGATHTSTDLFIQITPLNSNEVGSDAHENVILVKSGAAINNNAFAWKNTANQTLVAANWVCKHSRPPYTHWGENIDGNWDNAMDGYVALRFQVGLQTYYGWIRMDVARGAASFTVKDYAYNSMPEKVIYAGQNNSPYLVTNSISPASLCVGTNLQIPYTAYGTFDSSNIFTAQISNQYGKFDSSQTIGSVHADSTYSITAVIPKNIVDGSNYRVRVVSSNPPLTSLDNGRGLLINAHLPSNSISIFGDTSFCYGNFVQLAVQGGVGYQIVWKKNDSIIFYNNELTVYDAGNYQCEISDGCGTVNSRTIPVAVKPLPVFHIHPNDVLASCTGPITLKADSIPQLRYQWLKQYNNFGWDLAHDSTTTYVATQTANYTCLATDTAGCSSYAENACVYIGNPYSAIYALNSNTQVCNGSYAALLSFEDPQYDCAKFYYQYQWLKDGQPIAGANTNQLYVYNAGKYSLRVTDPYDNCNSISNAISVTSCVTGMANIEDENTFSIFPNPASDKIMLSFPSAEIRKIQITNTLGQVVFSEQINSAKNEIDVAELPSGIYIVSGQTLSQRIETKFLKQ